MFEPTELTLEYVFASAPSGVIAGARRIQHLADFPDLAAWGPRAAIRVWIVDFLLKELTTRQPGIWIWAKALDRSTCDHLTHDIESNGSAPAMAIAGGRFLSMTGRRGVFDLDEGVPLDYVPIDIFETRIFNLRVLYRSCADRSQKNDARRRQPLVGS